MGNAAFTHLSFASMGFGSQEYAQAGHFCTASQRVDSAFGKLGAQRLAPLLKVSDTEETAKQLKPWSKEFLANLWKLAGDEIMPIIAKKTKTILARLRIAMTLRHPRLMKAGKRMTTRKSSRIWTRAARGRLTTTRMTRNPGC